MKVVQRLETLLPDLDSPAFPVRDSASSRLEALGPAGVLAALRADVSNLTDEQRGRLAAFIRQNRNRTFEDPAAARKDVNFLIDALEYDDPAVRAAAREQLGQIFGHTVKFDVALTGDALTTAIDDLRKEAAALSAASAQPTTKPAS
jgi:HEAT repeat protein